MQWENDDHSCFLTYQRVRKELKRVKKNLPDVENPTNKYYVHLRVFVEKYLIWNIW